MQFESGYISLKGLRFYAFHGALPQEKRVGGDFVVSLRVGYPLAEAMQSDRLADTLDYAALYALVKKEMQQSSALLEHVAGRMADAIGKAFPQVCSLDLELTKLNPPMGADCEGASVEIHLKR